LDPFYPEEGASIKYIAGQRHLLRPGEKRNLSKDAGLSVMGCLGVLEAGARRGLVSDLRQAYINLLRQGIRFDIALLQDSLARLELPKL